MPALEGVVEGLLCALHESPVLVGQAGVLALLHGAQRGLCERDHDVDLVALLFLRDAVMTGATANRSVLGSLNDLTFLSRAVIDEQPEIDLTMLAMEVAETPCSPLKYESPRSVSLSLLRNPLI
jgi:hypothetical protein